MGTDGHSLYMCLYLVFHHRKVHVQIQQACQWKKEHDQEASWAQRSRDNTRKPANTMVGFVETFVFGDRVLLSSPGWPQTHNPPAVVLGGIPGMYRHAWSIHMIPDGLKMEILSSCCKSSMTPALSCPQHDPARCFLSCGASGKRKAGGVPASEGPLSGALSCPAISPAHTLLKFFDLQTVMEH